VSGRQLRVAWLGHRSTSSGDGIITYSREITDGLRERGVEVVFFHHEPELADEQSVVLDALSLSHRVVISRPGTRKRLLDALRQRRVDVVHASFAFSSLDFNLARTCHELGIPLVATFHVPFDSRFSLWRGISSAVYRLYSQALADCDAVIVFGEAQRDLLTGLGVPRQVVHILPNGVDTDRFSPGPSNRRREPGAERLFTYVGRLDPEKNVDVLLSAFHATRRPGTRMLVVGGGIERRRLERRYGDPSVTFTGVITDKSAVIDIFRGSDAFFLPSSVEGLSLAMLEAMACGVTTVATDVGSDGDALRGAGIVLDPVNLEAELRAAMKLLQEVPEVSTLLGRLSRERATERYSLSANLDGLIRLYTDLVESGPSLQRSRRAAQN
jgi:glycosyltransferase involved in cell wall biosynthesis